MGKVHKEQESAREKICNKRHDGSVADLEKPKRVRVTSPECDHKSQHHEQYQRKRQKKLEKVVVTTRGSSTPQIIQGPPPNEAGPELSNEQCGPNLDTSCKGSDSHIKAGEGGGL